MMPTIFGLDPSTNFLFGILFWFVVTVSLFVFLREFIMWYWKINEVVNLLKQIEKNTRKENDSSVKTGI